MRMAFFPFTKSNPGRVLRTNEGCKVRNCPSCRAVFNSVVALCPLCHEGTRDLEDMCAFLSEEVEPSGGFVPSYYEQLAVYEANNFWFVSRNRLILWALGHYFSNAVSLLEVGCGTGFVLRAIERAFPRLALFGAETHSAGLIQALGRVERAGLYQADARDISFAQGFQVVAAFDVLEHVVEDETVLAGMYRSTQRGGGLLLTVPQHPWLWSRQDDVSCHVRRYRADQIKARVRAAGFEVLRTTSFVTLLLPLMFAARLRKTALARDFDPMSEMNLKAGVNCLLEGILTLERAAISAGVSFPFGGSLLLVGRKP